MTPEGTNTNPIVYDLYAEMFWRGNVAPDLTAWVKQYYRRRYGLHPADGEDHRRSVWRGGGGGGAGAGAGGGCDAHAGNAWGLLQRSV